MRIVVVGAGAVGGYFGARLREAGAEVSFMARGETLDTLQSSGLRVSSPLGNVHLTRVMARELPEELVAADVVLLAVKAWQVPELAANLEPLVAEGGCVLPLQNGVEAPAQLAEKLGERRVLGGLCKILSQIESPGHIRHLGGRPAVSFGELDNRRSDRVEKLQQLMTASGIKVEETASIQAAMWHKFLFICAMSGVGAASRMPAGTLRKIPESRQLIEKVMEEIRQLALARGIPVDSDIVPRTMSAIDSLPAAATASMQRDMMAGKPSELESQTGAVVRLGRETGVLTPANEFLYSVLLPQERQATSIASHDGPS